MKFKTMDIVEQTNLGDLPCMVLAVREGAVNRYDLETIEGARYLNIPEYMMIPARPVEQSKYG